MFVHPGKGEGYLKGVYHIALTKSTDNSFTITVGKRGFGSEVSVFKSLHRD